MKRKIFSIVFAVVLALSFSLVTAVPAEAADINVPADHTTIQAAIDAATAGDTIIVADGIYTEDLTINTADLTLVSVNGALFTTIDGGGNPAVDVYATGVTIDGFTIDGDGDTGDRGIYLRNTGFTVQNNIFTDIANDAIIAESSQNVITSGLIHSNIITGEGADHDWHRNGILLEGYNNKSISGVTISENTVSECGNKAGDTEASGIKLADTGNGDVTDITVTGNTITDSFWGLYLRGSLTGTLMPITGNSIADSGTGILITAEATGVNLDSQLELTQNQITGNTVGIHVWDRWSTGSLTGNIDINYNDISGNDDGIDNEYTADVDARFNWWGDASGPEQATTNTTATGDEVSDYVDYSPWWGGNYLTGAAPSIAFAPHPWVWHVNETGGSSPGAIQEAIDEALEGDTVIVHDGTYTENIDIDKSLTVQSQHGWQKTTINGGGSNVVTVAGFAGTLLFGGGVGTGFEITNGSTGIDIEDLDGTANVTISDCFIWNNSTNGIHCGWVDPAATLTIEGNIITDNSGDGINFGTGSQIVEGTVTIYHNVIGAWAGDVPGESWESFLGNSGDGIYVYQLGMTGTMTIDYNIIAGNGVGDTSDGIYVETVGAHPDAANPNRGLHITNNNIGAWAFWNAVAEEYTPVPGNAYDGIEVHRSLQATFINIQGNFIAENDDDGIEFGPDGMIEGTVTILDNYIGAWTWYPADFQMPGTPYTFTGNYNGEGIEMSGVGYSGNVLIQRNKIAENGLDTGIYVNGCVVGGVLDILDNYIGAWTDAHDKSYLGNDGSGVEISCIGCDGGAATVVTIAGNTISKNTEDGIDIDQICDKHTKVTIDDNTITYNEDGIDIHAANRYAIVAISQNYIAYQEHGIRMGSSANGIDIVCNIITENEHGIWVKGNWNNISRNEISNNVGHAAFSGIHLESQAENNEIHYNNITGNSANLGGGVYSYGVFKEGSDTPPVNATNNWWGDASGPGGSGPGIGDSINDLVIYDPFEATALVLPCLHGGVGEEVGPVITKAEASPSMVSIWYDDMFADGEGMWGPPGTTYSVGPSCWNVFYVVAHDADSGVASVTMNWRDLLVDGLIPEEKLQKFLDQLELLPPEQRGPALDEWQNFMAELEALPFKYEGEYGCWYYDQECLCCLLNRTLGFFGHWLHWNPDEREVIGGEIMGQELQLGEFQVPVTVTDFKGNFTTGYIPITIVDFQMPVCEGWNLRSTWLALENNKWQDILATLIHDDGEGSLLRWNSQYQRWESYMEAGGVGYWYYGVSPIGTALMQPLEAYWIYSSVNDQFGLITERGITAPPSRQMYAGWNLIGADIHWELGDESVDTVFKSIEEATGHCTGYTQVLSVDQYNYWWEDLWVCDSWLYRSEYYKKWFEQDTWVYVTGEPYDGQDMSRGGGYWVFMANPAVLAGFNSTPLPVDFWMYWWGGP